MQGEERAALNMGIGWRGLNRMMERFKDNMEFTKLKPKMAGIDPDDVYSEVPYEKGFQFLWRIEREVGGSMEHGNSSTLPCNILSVKLLQYWTNF